MIFKKQKAPYVKGKNKWDLNYLNKWRFYDNALFKLRFKVNYAT